MTAVPIEDAADPRLGDYWNVPDPELLARRGLFVAEGRLVVGRLLTESPLTTRSVLVTPAAHAALSDRLAVRHDIPVYVVPQALIQTITGFNIHRGCLAIGERPPARSWSAVAGPARWVVALEGVANADNVGGVFRNAAAFGADAVLLGPACAHPLYRKAIRTSMGATLQVPFAHAAAWPGDLAALGALGFVSIAMVPGATADLRAICDTLPPGARVALVLGHEGDGLTAAARGACAHHAAVPMAPGADSLNVAVAAAIALYELSLSRRPG